MWRWQPFRYGDQKKACGVVFVRKPISFAKTGSGQTHTRESNSCQNPATFRQGALAELAMMAAKGCRFVCVGDSASAARGAELAVDLPVSVADMFTWITHKARPRDSDGEVAAAAAASFDLPADESAAAAAAETGVAETGGVPAWAAVSTMSVDVRMVGLSDGSPSTAQVDGQYTGEWDPASHRPHGRGTMAWDNGITYTGPKMGVL